MKRKKRLLVKAMELSMLCDCEIGIVMFGPENRLCHYASSDIGQVFRRFSSECFHGREVHNNDTLAMGYSRGIHEGCGRSEDHMGDLEHSTTSTSNRSESVSGCTSQQGVESEEHLSKEVSFSHRAEPPGRGDPAVVRDAQPMFAGPIRECSMPARAPDVSVLADEDEECYERIQQRFDSMRDAFVHVKGSPCEHLEEPSLIHHAPFFPAFPPHPDSGYWYAQRPSRATTTTVQLAQMLPSMNIPAAVCHGEQPGPRPILTPLHRTMPQIKTPMSGLPSPTDFPWVMLPTPRDSIISASAIQAILEEHTRYLNAEGMHRGEDRPTLDRCAAGSSSEEGSQKLEVCARSADPSVQVGPAWKPPGQRGPVTAS